MHVRCIYWLLSLFSFIYIYIYLSPSERVQQKLMSTLHITHIYIYRMHIMSKVCACVFHCVCDYDQLNFFRCWTESEEDRGTLELTKTTWKWWSTSQGKWLADAHHFSWTTLQCTSPDPPAPFRWSVSSRPGSPPLLAHWPWDIKDQDWKYMEIIWNSWNSMENSTLTLLHGIHGSLTFALGSQAKLKEHSMKYYGAMAIPRLLVTETDPYTHLPISGTISKLLQRWSLRSSRCRKIESNRMWMASPA